MSSLVSTLFITSLAQLVEISITGYYKKIITAGNFSVVLRLHLAYEAISPFHYTVSLDIF